MNKYIVTIKRDTVIIPLTIKAASINDCVAKVSKGYKFDTIVSIESQDDYRKRNKENASFGLGNTRVKTSRRFLLG